MIRRGSLGFHPRTREGSPYLRSPNFIRVA